MFIYKPTFTGILKSIKYGEKFFIRESKCPLLILSVLEIIVYVDDGALFKRCILYTRNG